MILLPDAYIYMRHIRAKARLSLRLLWWLPSLLLAIFTVGIGCSRDFAPKDNTILNSYLFLFGLFVVPKLVFAIFSLVGHGVKIVFHTRRNYGAFAGGTLAVCCLYVLFYGIFIGFGKLDVRHEDYYSETLPALFDGYRIVHFSDAHVGTYGRSYAKMLSRAVDSMNAQHPDLIVFTGDLQNMRPDEIRPHVSVLGRLKASDGVFSVLGNHDYGPYRHWPSKRAQAENLEDLKHRQSAMGWHLLLNANEIIRRGNDSIAVVGVENDGKPPFPALGDLPRATKGTDGMFKLLLSHDPSHWRRKVIPETDIQLMLAGHTHAMQFRLGDFSPSSWIYPEWGGLYTTEEGQGLYVSAGLGSVMIPYRFGAWPEISVITLRRK